MRHAALRLLAHPVIRSLVFERVLLTASAALAAAALLTGRVAPREVPGLLDLRLLSLFLVLTIAVELGKASDLFDRLVAAVAGRVRSARALALGMIAVSGTLAAVLTNDVALFLVVPFTMLFRRVTDLDLAPVVVLEVAAANVVGCVSPLGNPQNLYLYHRGAFTPAAFFAAQLPWCAAAAALLALAVPLLVPSRPLGAPPVEPFDVELRQAVACVALLAAEVLALFGRLDHRIPLALAAGGALLLGRRLFDTDFSLVLVFALLFVGVAGLERGRLYELLDPVKIFGHHARGMVLSGALLSQAV
ncbi:MAG: SLC13 family permease, partial [Syntrophomonadaceae bacterium]